MAGRPFLPAGDPWAAGLGGTEQAILHLTMALAARGHRVAVANGSAVGRDVGGVAWLAPGPTPGARVTVAINDARLLPQNPGLPIIWFHNEVDFGRELRKRRMRALWRHRPAALFIGGEQARLASRLLPFRARATIPYALPPSVLAAAPASTPPGPQAIFTSQAYRGLARLIDLWRDHIAPRQPDARFTAYIGAGDVPAYQARAAGVPSIAIRPRVGNDAMLDVLRGARVLLAPGHRSETFCLAAAEAIAMGVPVVTLGIGSLKERVRHGATGFIARNRPEMAARTLEVLSDDPLWYRLHEGGLAMRAGNDWDRTAAMWEAFAQHDRRPA